MVIGVQYRRIRFNFFSRVKADSAYLDNKKNQWVSFEGSSRATDSGKRLEVNLEEEGGDIDSLELDDDIEGLEAIDNFIFVKEVCS